MPLRLTSALYTFSNVESKKKYLLTFFFHTHTHTKEEKVAELTFTRVWYN